ncbi:hypothetical protein LG296_20010 (plasmid) [Ureibacillus chungkukjangi]|uniref:hypothetical protein n=1 Tax=Ureibacillus chungkukjangi TaxID=1202712 RepID=UPI000D35EA4D|nr:hypothetical protein [Ureibacillus chungkukjangi]
MIRYSKLKKRLANDSDEFHNLKNDIKTYGFNRAVELEYLSYSSGDMIKRSGKRKSANRLNKTFSEKLQKYGEIHPDYNPLWRPTKDEFKYSNEILKKGDYPALYQESSKFKFEVYRGSHAFIGVIKAPSLEKPKILLGENLTEVTRATIKQYKDITGSETTKSL